MQSKKGSENQLMFFSKFIFELTFVNLRNSWLPYQKHHKTLTIWMSRPNHKEATTTNTKLLQSCPTLCDPIDGRPPGSPVYTPLNSWNFKVCKPRCVTWEMAQSSFTCYISL